MLVTHGFRSDVLWAMTWGFGVACGVALGAWLTATGTTGAPGAASLDVGRELLLMPASVGGAVVVVYVAVAGASRFLRRGAAATPTPASEPTSDLGDDA